MIPVLNLLALHAERELKTGVSFASLNFKGIFLVTFYIAFVSGEESRVGWMAAVGGMAWQRTGWTAAAAGSGTKPKNVKGEYATLRVCQQSSEDS